jgi:hypothetical protein
MNSKRFIIGFLVVVALIGAVSIYVSMTTERAVQSITAVTSPDKKLKAVKTTLSNGGAAPFCFDTIVVLPTIYPDDFHENRDAYEVYAAPCGRFADGTPSPQIEWLSATSLRITSAPHPAGAKNVRMKDIDITKTVQVTFVVRP